MFKNKDKSVFESETPISDVLLSINKDLIEAAKKRPNDYQTLFEIDSADVELFVNVKSEKGIGGSVKWYVFNFDGKKSVAKHTGHKITIRLKALSGNQEISLDGIDTGETDTEEPNTKRPFGTDKLPPLLFGTPPQEG